MSKVVKVIAMVVVAAAIIVFAPQIAGFLVSLGATSVTAGAVAAAGIGLAISTALSVAMSFFVKPPSLTNAMIDRLNSQIQPTAPRKIVFGRTAAGNDIRFFEEHGKNDHYTQVVALASHKIEGLRQYWMEEQLTWQNNDVQGDFESGVRFLRVVTEGHTSNVQEVGTGELWKPTATFTGCAYAVVSFRLENDCFEKGFPSKTAWIVDGCPLYDPRRDSTRGGVGPHRLGDQNSWRFYDGAVEIGRNPALALATYLTGYRINGKLVWGLGVPADRIDWDNIRDYANLCEERVTMQGGGTTQRYTVDVIFSTADSHESVINALSTAMGSCKLTDVGGKYCLIGGYDDTLEPTVDFTADHLVGAPGQPAPYSWIPVPPARETYNIARGRFSDPENQFQLADWGAIETDPLPDLVPRTMQLDFGAVSRAETCQRIAKQILLREALTPGHFAGTFGPLAFAATVGSLVTLSLPAEGWNRKLFRVIEQAETHDLLFQMTLREEDPGVYAWDREEKPLPPSIRPPGYNPRTTFAPAGLDVTSHTVANIDGVETSEVTVTWTPEDSGQVRAIQIESQPHGADTWTEQAASANPATGSFTFMSNRPAALLTVRARFRMASGVYSGWATHDVETAPVAIVDSVARGTANAAQQSAQETAAALAGKADIDTTPPPQVTGVAASSSISDLGANLTITWTASPATDLASYVVAVKEGSGPYNEALITTNQFAIDGLRRNQAHTVRVRAIDNSGNKGAWSSEVVHTTTSDTVPPALPTGLSATASFQNIYLKWTNPADGDLAGVEVWENTTNNSATATKVVTVNALPSEAGGFARSGLTSGVQRYYWLKAVDTSGNKSAFTAAINATTASVSETDFTPTASGIAPLKIVSTLPASGNFEGRLVFLTTDDKLYRYTGSAWTAAVATTDLSGTIASSQIADAAITTAKFASGIAPVEVLTQLPSTGNFVGRQVFLTTDSKVYRYTGSAWTAAIASTDVSGQLTDAQIAAVGAAKLTGQITGTQITDDAITTAKLAAGAVTANEIAANTITSAKIAGGTITATEIAGGTITGAKIAAGTITSSNIAADTITAGQIAAGAISTSEIAADAVTTAKIAAGAVTATEIAANTITAAKLAAGTITATEIAASTITGAKIAADTIATGHIVAGAITATEIASGAITASKLGIRGENIWPDPYCQDLNWWKGPTNGSISNAGYVSPANDANTTAGGWQFFSVVTPALAARVGGGKGYWQLWDNAGAGYLGTATTQVVPPSLWAKPSTTYELGFGCTNGSNKPLLVKVQYFKADGTQSGSTVTLITWSAGDQSTIYYRVKFTTPADCNTVRIYFEVPSGAAFSGFISAGNLALREAASGTMIVDGSITSSHITVNSLDGDRITAGSLAVSKLETTGSLPATLTIGSTGATLATVQSQANDPAARVNANTTLIQPGKVVISGSTTLDTWRNATDTTKIEGGKIATNSITANQIAANAITASEIAGSTITAAKMVAGTITAASGIMADAAITNAKIANLSVDTIKIAGNAVTVPVSAFTATSLGLPDGVWTTVQQANITSSGAPILIIAGHSMEVEAATDRDVDYRILRDGAIIYQIDDVSFSTYMASADWALHNITVTDTPGAGAHTYQFQAKTNDGASCRNRSLALLETKR